MATDDSDDLDLLSLLRPRRVKPAQAPPSSAPVPTATSPVPAAPPPAPSPDVPPQAAQGTSAPQPAADPSDDEDDLGVSIRTSGRRPSRTAPATPARAASSPDVPIASVRVGTERLLDSGAPDAHLRRVASVTEAQRWTAIREHLSAAGPDLRWRAWGWIVQQEIAFAEKVVNDCRRPRRGGQPRPRKADLVEVAVDGLEGMVEHVEEILSRLGPDLAVLSTLIQALDRAGDSMGLARSHLAALCGEGVWMNGWSGCDVGVGVPGYDTPGAVDRHREAVKAEVERFRARREAQAAQRPKRAAYVEPPPRAVGILGGTEAVGLFDAPLVDPDAEEG